MDIKEQAREHLKSTKSTKEIELKALNAVADIYNSLAYIDDKYIADEHYVGRIIHAKQKELDEVEQKLKSF